MNKKHKKFPIALILINLFLFSSTYETYWNIPHIVKYIFSVAALVYIFQFYTSSRINIAESRFDQIFVGIFIVVSVALLVNSIRFDIFYIQEVFGERYFFLPFLMPIIFLRIKYNLFFFKNVLKYTYFLIFPAIIVELVILLFFRDFAFYVTASTAIYTFSLAPMLLITVSSLYRNSMINLSVYIYFILFAFICALWGRRGETIEPLFFIIIPFLIKLFSNDLSIKKRLTMLFSSLLLLLLIIFLFQQNVNSLGFAERGGFTQDAFNDSRGETIAAFFSDFGTASNDWIFGRGLNGTVTKFFFGDNTISRSIEIGYFNILLKGGWLYLSPMLILFLRSAYLGLFNSKNFLSKGLAFIVIWQIIYMGSFAMANFSPNYIFVWIAVGANFDRKIRAIPNQELTDYFNDNR